jgi:hypothetical protein
VCGLWQEIVIDEEPREEDVLETAEVRQVNIPALIRQIFLTRSRVRKTCWRRLRFDRWALNLQPEALNPKP